MMSEAAAPQLEEVLAEQPEYLRFWAYKRRTGFLGSSAASFFLNSLSREAKGSSSSSIGSGSGSISTGASGSGVGNTTKRNTNPCWEMRSFSLRGTRLSYYDLGKEEFVDDPRGTLDLLNNNVEVNVVPMERDAPTPYQIEVKTTSATSSPPAIQNSKSESSMSTPVSTSSMNDNKNNKSKANKGIIEWKICFDQQEDLIQFLDIAHRVQDKGGLFVEKDRNRFEHELNVADHIFRWEMIVCPPVIYPIQIHGIVLEAGRNCVVVADFGLTGYGRKEGKDFNHADDHLDDNSDYYDAISAAWKKLRPNQQDQRLNILTLTDPYEIRKWHRAKYDDESMFHNVKALSKIGSTVTGSVTTMATSVNKTFSRLHEEELNTNPSNGAVTNDGTYTNIVCNTSTTDLDSSFELNDTNDTEVASNSAASTTQQPSPQNQRKPPRSPNTKQSQKQSSPPSKKQSPSSSKDNKDGSDSNDEDELPQSDPKEIVLARANWLLENEDVLPPYHVFYSNSECIAVWCKTGRWSTLQTAVFLSSNSVGAAKSSILATVGVAAANPLLAPVIAVGGLIWVSAPMVILKHSRGKWEETTQKMTDLFWSIAPPQVYVCAIQNWCPIFHANKDHENKIEGGGNRRRAGSATIAEEGEDDNNEQEDGTPRRRVYTT